MHSYFSLFSVLLLLLFACLRLLVFVQRIVNADQNLFGVQATTQYPDVLMLVI